MLHSGLSRSGITRLLCLKVWFGNGFNRIDLPRLQTLDFGANAFRGSGSEGIDLPELITIQMDWNTFRFSTGCSATSLVMRSLSGCEE